MKEELIRAIEERRVIEFDYHGRHRVGEPHLLGYDADNLGLEIFQSDGGSISGGVPKWRTPHVSAMSNLVVTDTLFNPRADFNPNRKRWRQILASV